MSFLIVISYDYIKPCLLPSALSANSVLKYFLSHSIIFVPSPAFRSLYQYRVHDIRSSGDPKKGPKTAKNGLKLI